MQGERVCAVIACFLIAFGSHIGFTHSQLNDSKIISNSEIITSTEVRIHNFGQEWSQPEQLIWYPNLPASERFFQFSIIINGVSDSTVIDYCNLTVTWEYNLTSDSPILSTSLNVNSFTELNDKLILNYAYQYPDNVFYGKYFINLETSDNEGNNYSFSHPGIEILQYGITIEKFNDNPNGQIIFSQGQLTEIEFDIRNIGVSYSNLFFNLTLENSMPSGWEYPLMYNTNNTSLWGGESIYSYFSLQAPDDIYSNPPPENLDFKFTASYENNLEEIVELTNKTISFTTVVVPIFSSPIFSVYGDENETYLIGDSLSQEPLENLVMTSEGRSVSIYMSIINYGFEYADLEMEITSDNPLDLWTCNVYIGQRNKIDAENNRYVVGSNLQPLEEVKLRLEFNFSNTTFNQEEISIYLENMNNNQDRMMELTIINYQINNPLLDPQNPMEQSFQLGDIYQNESIDFQLAFAKNPYFEYFNFENLWLLDIEANNSLSQSNLPNFNPIIISNETNYFPLQLQINSRNVYTVSINLSESIEIGNYSINLLLTQISNDESNSLSFSKEINFHVLENSSLIVDNETQSNNSTNNSQSNNSTNNSQNNSGNNDANLTNNTSVDDGNETFVDNNSTDVSNPPQDNGTIIQNIDDDTNDSTKSNNYNSKSWIFMIMMIVVVGSIMAFIIQRRRLNNSTQTTSKETININPIMPQPIIPDLNVNQVTILRQWTDANGYTWRQMSDRSVLWWNGHDWVPVNQNQ